MAIIGLCLSVYFSYHLIAGHRGIISLIQSEKQLEQLDAKYQLAKYDRLAIEKKVVMLRPGSIDRDFLEERARYLLGFHRADEVIIIDKKS